MRNRFHTDVALDPDLSREPEYPAITHGDTINALRILGHHELADDLTIVVIQGLCK